MFEKKSANEINELGTVLIFALPPSQNDSWSSLTFHVVIVILVTVYIACKKSLVLPNFRKMEASVERDIFP